MLHYVASFVESKCFSLMVTLESIVYVSCVDLEVKWPHNSLALSCQSIIPFWFIQVHYLSLLLILMVTSSNIFEYHVCRIHHWMNCCDSCPPLSIAECWRANRHFCGASGGQESCYYWGFSSVWIYELKLVYLSFHDIVMHKDITETRMHRDICCCLLSTAEARFVYCRELWNESQDSIPCQSSPMSAWSDCQLVDWKNSGWFIA